MLAGSPQFLHGGDQAAKLPDCDHNLQGLDQPLVVASTLKKHQMVLEKHHMGVCTADTPCSGHFQLEKEKQKAQ